MTKFQKTSFILGITLIIIAIILGAFGAHGLEGKIPQEKIDTFEVGVRYQMYHGFGIILLAVIAPYFSLSIRWIPRIMLLGVLLFSGSIYLLSTQALTGMDLSKILGPLTPVGGLLMIVSWIMLLVRIIQQKN